MQPRLALLIGVTILLAACTPPPQEAPAPPPVPAAPPPAPPSDSPEPEPAAGECGVDKLVGYVGQQPGGDTMAKIQAAVGHDRIRTIKPGDAVTMDYRPDRLNVEVGEDGRIKVLRCG